MIINNFHVVWAIFPPLKADSPLLVDADALLSIPVSAQRLKAIAGKVHQILNAGSAFKYLQSLFRLLSKRLETRYPSAVVEFFRVFTGE
jgi:hypothetical protein